MILGKLELNEQQTMSFGINVFGTTEQPTDIRFVIEGKKFDIVCKCKQIGEDLEVEIPQMRGILESGEYQTRLEVIIGDKIFTPLKESIEFNKLVEFGVEKKSIKVQHEGVEISVKGSSSKEMKKDPLEELEAAGFTVVESNGFQVIKKDEKYAGFVSESGVIKSDKLYDSLSELVESMSS